MNDSKTEKPVNAEPLSESAVERLVICKNFNTPMEKILWEMLYKSQMALADMCRDEMNRNRADDNDWPCGMGWKECNGSSHSIFCRVAREKAGIDHETYLEILRENEDAMDISEQVYEELLSR